MALPLTPPLTNVPETMRALAFAEHGPASKVVELMTVPTPATVPAGFVLIKVHAAALNPIDHHRAEGALTAIMPEATFPAVVGYDLSGVIAKTGEDVDSFAVGDEVVARMQTSPNPGAIAQYALVDVATLAKKPEGVSFTDAASLGLAGQTALQALRRIGAAPGKKVFISGGAGGVGTLAIQIAKLLGAESVATTASAGEKAKLCSRLGADTVVDYKTQKFEEELSGYDAAFDTTGESAKCASVAATAGKIVTIAGTPTVHEMRRVGLQPGFVVRMFLWMGRDKAAMAAAKKANADWSYMFLQPNGEDMAQLLSWAAEGKLEPVIDGVWSLDDATKAAARCFSGRAMGKCVVRVVDEPATPVE